MKKIPAFCFLLLFSFGARADADQDWGMWLSNTYQTDFGGSDYLAFLELAPPIQGRQFRFQSIDHAASGGL